MAFHNHRKLLNASRIIDPILTAACTPFCDAENNHNGLCPIACIALCYPVCYAPLPPGSLPPPPPLPQPQTEVLSDVTIHKHQKLSLLLTVSLAVLATLFILFTCYTAYKFFIVWSNTRRRRRGLQRTGPGQEPDDYIINDDHDQGPVIDHHVWYIRTVGLQPSVINAISTVKFKKGDGLIEGTDCSVCLSEFIEDETLRLLPKCNHAFHVPCIDTWLRSHTTCPLCRAGIVKNTAELVTGEVISVRASGPVEEARNEEGSGSNRGSEMRVGIEEDNESRALARPKYDDDGMQPIRRSVSLDALSASMISSAVAGHELVEEKSPVNEVSGEVGSSSVKRSLSCSAKVFLSRYSGGSGSRSRNSVLPR